MDIQLGLNTMQMSAEIGGDMLTIEQFLGTLMHSSLEIWKQHLLTDDYNKHVILNDFYDEVIEKVDSLVEHWFGVHGKVKSFDNVLIVENLDVVNYFEKLAKIVRVGVELFCKESELKSDGDDILGLIDSTLYKYKELAESKGFIKIPSFGDFRM